MKGSGVKKITTGLLLFGGLLFCSLPAFAKDLFVALNGNDTVSYAANSIDTPWATVAKGIYSLKAGDTLNIRGGEYVQIYPLTIHSQYRNKNPLVVMEAESGTADKPIVVK